MVLQNNANPTIKTNTMHGINNAMATTNQNHNNYQLLHKAAQQ